VKYVGMYRARPWLLLSALVVSALAAVTVGLGQTPEITGASDPAGSSSVVAAFDSALRATLDAPNYIFVITTVPGRIYYQAPDRTEAKEPYLRVVVIGQLAYTPWGGSQAGSRTRWGYARLNQFTNHFYGPGAVKSLLQTLSRLNSVQVTRSGFVAREVVDGTSIDPGDYNEVLAVYRVAVQNGFVTRVTSHVEGPLPIPSGDGLGIRDLVTHEQRGVVSSYSAIGSSPAVADPPAPLIRLTCNNASVRPCWRASPVR
jgi:hypothetical protein